MLSTKIAHSLRAVEVVDHQEPAAQQVLAQLRGLLVGQVPLPDLDGIEPRPIEHVVAVLEIDGLLDGARVDDAQAADERCDVPVAARIVDGPARAAVLPLAAPAHATGYMRRPNTHSAGSRKSVGSSKSLVLDARVLAKRQRVGERHADET